MIYILLANGFEEVEALAPLDLLRRADLEVKTVSIEETLAVTGAHGVTVMADIMPEDATEKISLLILPGGMPGTTNLDASFVTDGMIKRTVEDGGHLAAICAAPLILGKRGLLSGKHAICYPGYEEYLEGAILYGDAVVTDGKITTANGMQSALEFGNELVKVMKTGYGSNTFAQNEDISEEDSLFHAAVEVALECGKVSSSLLQRRLSVGYGRAAKLIDRMTELGFTSAPNGQCPRTVLISAEQYTAFLKKCEDDKTE